MPRLLIKSYIPAIALFIVLNALFIIMADRFHEWGFNTDVLLLGNLLLFLICTISFLMGSRALTTKSTHSFLRLVYGSFILKLVILAAAAFIYITMAKKDVNKPALFFCMGLYIIYTFIEVNTLMKTARKRTHV
jgi:hypothetical protein